MQVPEVSIIDQSATVITGERSLRAIALAQPATIRVFERYNLDYCCGGRRPLAEACAEAAIELPAVLDRGSPAVTEVDRPGLDEPSPESDDGSDRIALITSICCIHSSPARPDQARPGTAGC